MNPRLFINNVYPTLLEFMSIAFDGPSLKTEIDASLSALDPKLPALLAKLVGNVLAFVKNGPTDSSNSSVPPSADPSAASRHRKKAEEIKNSQPSGKTKPGGQPGHEPHFLPSVAEPDEILKVYNPLIAQEVQLHPENFEITTVTSRQVVGLIVVRYVRQFDFCEVRDRRTGTVFPPPDHEGEAWHRIQYDHGLQAHAIVLNFGQMLPSKRLATYFQDLGLTSLSPATVCTFVERCAEKLSALDFRQKLLDEIEKSPYVCVDETGMTLSGKKVWFFTLSTPEQTAYFVSLSRGKDAKEVFEFLKNYRGVLVHDCWRPYLKSLPDNNHSLCHAHVLRELKGVTERDGWRWAENFARFFQKYNALAEKSGGMLSDADFRHASSHFDTLVTRAKSEVRREMCEAGDAAKKYGKAFTEAAWRSAHKKSLNLLKRLEDLKEMWLRWTKDPFTPYTNNLAERDLRMNKVREKVSGCFRTMKGAENFCLIRSLLSTLGKHGHRKLIQALTKFLEADPKEIDAITLLSDLDRFFEQKLRPAS